MTIITQILIEEIIKKGYLYTDKIKAEVFEEINYNTNEKIYVLEAKGVSKRNKTTYTAFEEFPFTEQGLEKAHTIAEELNNWS